MKTLKKWARVLAFALCFCMLLGCQQQVQAPSISSSHPPVQPVPASSSTAQSSQPKNPIVDAWIPYNKDTDRVPTPPVILQDSGMWASGETVGEPTTWSYMGLYGQELYYLDNGQVYSYHFGRGEKTAWGKLSINTTYASGDWAQLPNGMVTVEKFLDENGVQREGVVFFNAEAQKVEYYPFEWEIPNNDQTTYSFYAVAGPTQVVYSYQKYEPAPQGRVFCLEMFDTVTKERTLLAKRPSTDPQTGENHDYTVVMCNGEYIGWADADNTMPVAREFLEVYDLQGNFIKRVEETVKTAGITSRRHIGQIT